jgi:hypothetical protein
MTPRLISCEGCERHVFASELHCPFCRAPITRTVPALSELPPGLSRAQRLGLRAQSLALAAAMAGPGLLACTDNRQPDPPAGGRGGSAGSGASGGAGEGPLAGAGPLAGDGGSGFAGRPARSGEPSVMPLYGAPVPADAGPRAGSNANPSSGASGGSSGAMAASPRGNPAPVYGASPPVK